MNVTALVLAAGAGTRMKSDLPKVAHELLGKALVRWVVDAAREAGCTEVVTVLGHGREFVAPLVRDTVIAIQEEQLGTGHAIMIARDHLEGRTGSLVVLSGDSPLIRAETIATLARMRKETEASVCVLTQIADTPFGYGRVVRDEQGHVLRIVEQKDCTPEEALLRECNSGIYCFDIPTLLDCLDRLSTENAQGEYYLTDVIEICVNDGRLVSALVVDDAAEALGVNSRRQLAQATKHMQQRINDFHLDNGVTMIDPDLVWIGPGVVIESDVELLPLTYLSGETIIGKGTVVGPNSRVIDAKIGRNCTIDETIIFDAELEDNVVCGPRAYLRPGTYMCTGSKAGTHVEIKKSRIGTDAKVPHLSYIGDATLGHDVNIGAGAITCNYDGVDKHPTVIGDGAFIGSDTMLVAPVTVGAGAVTGAGSVIAKDVPDDALALERNEQHVVEGWARHRRESE